MQKHHFQQYPLLVICIISVKLAPAYRAGDTVKLLHCETPQFISSANGPDLNPVDYCVLGMIQERMYRVPTRDTEELQQWLVEIWSKF